MVVDRRWRTLKPITCARRCARVGGVGLPVSEVRAVRYQGGKARMAARLSAYMLVHTRKRDCYVEPFIGGGSVLEKMVPHFKRVYANDLREDVVLLWQAASQGWEPPEDVSQDLYESLRDAPPSPLRGFVGVACSFASKWFGGYARGISPNGVARNYAAEGRRAVLKRAAVLQVYADRIAWSAQDYASLAPVVQPEVVVYCDPPYGETTSYKGLSAFDTAAFWNVQSAWADTGAKVFVSEYAAPPGWVSEVDINRHSSAALFSAGQRATERLFEWRNSDVRGGSVVHPDAKECRTVVPYVLPQSVDACAGALS